MTAQIKTTLAFLTSLLLVVAVWTLQYQMKPIVGVLVIGIAGTLLIFSAEFFYSWRKRKHFTIRSIRNWLRLHIAVGIIGPLVILWHTGLNFYGFAGWLALLTGVVLLSGFTGRYIYRQTPRSIKGQELCLKEIQSRMGELDEKLSVHLEKTPQSAETIQILRSKFPLLSRQIEIVRAHEEAEQAEDWRLMLKLTADWHLGRVRTRRNSSVVQPIEQNVVKQVGMLELERFGLVKKICVLKTSKGLLAK